MEYLQQPHLHLAVQVDQQGAAQQAQAREQQAARRHRRTRQPRQPARCVALFGQAVQHAAGGEDAAVGRGRGRGQHHEVDQAGRSGNARQHEQLHERALVRHHLAPRRDRHDRDQRQHVEDDDAHRNRVDRLG
ncbi:hypothetical protein G6F31_018798 [Rhizopus arrhizus]|nr:hypothetical protein G6F31_018798 [Rhizopus arrhizus]